MKPIYIDCMPRRQMLFDWQKKRETHIGWCLCIKQGKGTPDNPQRGHVQRKWWCLFLLPMNESPIFFGGAIPWMPCVCVCSCCYRKRQWKGHLNIIYEMRCWNIKYSLNWCSARGRVWCVSMIQVGKRHIGIENEFSGRRAFYVVAAQNPNKHTYAQLAPSKFATLVHRSRCMYIMYYIHI